MGFGRISYVPTDVAEPPVLWASDAQIGDATFNLVAAPGAGYAINLKRVIVNNKDWNQLLCAIVSDAEGAANAIAGLEEWGFDRSGGIVDKDMNIVLPENESLGAVCTDSDDYTVSVAYTIVAA